MHATIVWTQTDCHLCERIKKALAEDGFEERPAEDLLRGTEPDRDALAQLAMQDMQLPLVMRDGAFVDPEEILGQDTEAA